MSKAKEMSPHQFNMKDNNMYYYIFQRGGRCERNSKNGSEGVTNAFKCILHGYNHL